MEIKKVQVGLSEITIGRISEIAQFLGTNNRADAIRYAAEMVSELIHAHQRGEKIYVEHRFGSAYRLVLK